MQKAAEFIKKHADYTAGAILFLITLLFFLPGLSFDRIPLDTHAYVSNEYLLMPTWENFIHHLKNPVLDLYSPLVMHSFMLDYWVWGKELLIAGGRLHNIILHSINAILFFFLLRQVKFCRINPENPITIPLPAAIFGTLCFALHPQRVESVIWLVERKDVLVLFFGLASSMLFVYSYRKNDLRLSGAGALVYLLSFGTKPLMLTLPLILLLGIWVCDCRFEWKKVLKLLAPYLAAATVYITLNAIQLSGVVSGSANGAFSAERLQIVNLNCTNYFFKTLLPLNIQPLYPAFRLDNTMKLLCFLFWSMVIAVLVLSVIRWKYRHQMRSLWLPVLIAFGIALLPMAGFRVIGNAEFADRYSYYPSLFIWLAVTVAYVHLAPRREIWLFSFWAYAFLTVVLGFCYLQSWQSKESFINAALIQGENSSPVALRIAAWHSFEEKDFDSALSFAHQAFNRTGEWGAEEAALYLLAMQGMVALEKDDYRGLQMIDRAITSPAWDNFRFSSVGFAEAVLLKSASLHIMLGTPQDMAFAKACFITLAELSMGHNPVRELSFLAYAAYLDKDYEGAEKFILQALERSPGDPVLLKDLEDYRKLKNSPAKAASN